METQSILNNILAHRMDGEGRHPEKTARVDWGEKLQERLDRLTAYLDGNRGEQHPLESSRLAAQLAGQLVRMIEELEWPLSEPGQKE